jgi:hypothetical protein
VDLPGSVYMALFICYVSKFIIVLPQRFKVLEHTLESVLDSKQHKIYAQALTCQDVQFISHCSIHSLSWTLTTNWCRAVSTYISMAKTSGHVADII